MPTPHNSANKGDFAKVVIMPGDPKRSEYIANKFLENPVLVNDIRGIKGFTGTYKGKKISVMAHGMGMPSMGIYAHELFDYYDVDYIIRVGTCGAISDDLELKEVIIANPVITNSNIVRAFPNIDTSEMHPSNYILDKIKEINKTLNLNVNENKILTSEFFYNQDDDMEDGKAKGAVAIEMETFMLYLTAANLNKKALSLLSVSDLINHPEKALSAEERQTSFDKMLILALETAIKL